jgi:anti-anti-sigma factor
VAGVGGPKLRPMLRRAARPWWGRLMVEHRVRDRAADYVVIEMRGELLDDASIDRVRESLEDHYVDDGVRLIRVDLSEVTYITLEGIQMLIGLWRESRERGKQFRAENARGQVSERLRIAGITRLLDPEA